MSASMRPARAPALRRATARLVATVDLPTPPLPLDTATTWRIPGRLIFCGPIPCGCIVISFRLAGGQARRLNVGGFPGALRALAQRPQVLEGVQPRVVAVVPDDLVGVAADGGHGDR